MNLIQSTFYEQILLMKEKSIWEFNPHSETFNVAVVGGGRWGKILGGCGGGDMSGFKCI